MDFACNQREYLQPLLSERRKLIVFQYGVAIRRGQMSPRITIITAVHNRVSTIEATIQSVLSQRDSNIEYIVVDGNSKDGTEDVIRRYEGRIAKYIREADSGIYNALNKGIQASTGDIIGFLHADDVLLGVDSCKRIAEAFCNKNVDATYGDLVYVDQNRPEKIVRYWKSKQMSWNAFGWGWMPPHPTFYLRRRHYIDFGFYREDFEIAADYELMLRMLHKHRLKTAYLEGVLIQMRLGGKSNANFNSHLCANREDKRAWNVNGLKPPSCLRILKPMRKILQYWYRPNKLIDA